MVENFDSRTALMFWIDSTLELSTSIQTSRRMLIGKMSAKIKINYFFD